MPQSFASLHCHLVFSTKNRKPLINQQLQPRLFAYIGGILKDLSCELVAAGGMPDHVHLLVSMPRTLSIADAVRAIKSNSSGWIHKEFTNLDAFKWQDGYGAFAVSYSNLGTVKAYLANQAKHHEKLSFQEELLQLLRRHDLTWDERYIWD